MENLNNPFRGIIVIPLTKGYSVMVDAIDVDLIEYEWHSMKSTSRHIYGITGSYGNRRYALIHRAIMLRIRRGLSIAKYEVDHINGDTLDNRRINLRIATHAENIRNGRKHRDGNNPYKGITRKGKRWQARITVNYKHHYLGTFDTPEEAHEAYCAAAKEYHKEFARLD